MSEFHNYSYYAEQVAVKEAGLEADETIKELRGDIAEDETPELWTKIAEDEHIALLRKQVGAEIASSAFDGQKSWGSDLWIDFNISPDYGLGLHDFERFDLIEYSECGEDIKRITIEDIEKAFGSVEAQGVIDSDLVIWTDKNVVYVHDFDGWESLRNLPRNPELDQDEEKTDIAKIRFEDSFREGLSKESLWKLYVVGKKKSCIWPVESWRDFYISTDYGGGSYFCVDSESRFNFEKINRCEDEKDENMAIKLITKEEIERSYGKIEAQGFIDGVITIWTDQNIVYVHYYDGDEWLCSYPRNPVNKNN